MTVSQDTNLDDARERYILPNNFEEIDRMRNQHEWVKGCAAGLINAPIDFNTKGLKVLDSATADGFWISDVRSLFSEDTEFVGFDIAAELYPPVGLRPRNVHLERQDLLQPIPSSWQNAFDLVHQRFIFPIFKDAEVDQVLHRLIDCVKPGGWIQLVEPDAAAHISDPKAASFQMLHKLAAKVMNNPSVSSKLISSLKSAGLVNVEQQVVDMVVGSSHENRELGIRGRKNMCTILRRYMGITSPEAFGLTPEQWEDLPAEFEKDMDQYKTALRHHIIWAQKPEKLARTAEWRLDTGHDP